MAQRAVQFGSCLLLGQPLSTIPTEDDKERISGVFARKRAGRARDDYASSAGLFGP